MTAQLAIFERWADDPNAYATLQPELRYFTRGDGYIAYREALGAPVVINDPIGAPDALPALVRAFVAERPRAMFVNLSNSGAALVAAHSPQPLRFVCTGTEHVIELPAAPPRAAASALRKARRGGLEIMERTGALEAGERAVLEGINAQFLRRSQAGRELPFIARGMCFDAEPGVRLFALYERGAPLGFFTLDPWRAQGRLIGAQLNQIRFGPTRLWGVYLAVVAALLPMLEAEGLEGLALGGCAFHDVDHPHALPGSAVYEGVARRAASHADRLHAMSNLTKVKLTFSGRSIHRFLAAPHRLPLLPIARLLVAARIIDPLRRWRAR